MIRHAFFMVFLVLCVTGDTAQASPGILLVEETYTVWGDAGYPVVNTYFESGQGIVTGSATGTGVPGAPSTAASTAGPTELLAFRNGMFANAYAQSSYLFRPDYSHLLLDVCGTIGEWAFENLAHITVTDMTTATLVDSFVSPHTLEELDSVTIHGFSFEFQRILLVDPDHTYELVGWVEAHRLEGGHGAAGMRIDFYSIPAPSALILAALGTVVMMGLRKRGTPQGS